VFGVYMCACFPYVILIPEFYSAFQDCYYSSTLCVCLHTYLCASVSLKVKLADISTFINAVSSRGFVM
jgi:hypothetical protein